MQEKQPLWKDMSRSKAAREASEKYTLWTIAQEKDKAKSKSMFVKWQTQCQQTSLLAVAYAEEHSSYDEDEGLPEEEPSKQGNNKKREHTVNAKLKAVDLAEVFQDADLTLLQGRRLCREYLSDTRKKRTK